VVRGPKTCFGVKTENGQEYACPSNIAQQQKKQKTKTVEHVKLETVVESVKTIRLLLRV